MQDIQLKNLKFNDKFDAKSIYSPSSFASLPEPEKLIKEKKEKEEIVKDKENEIEDFGVISDKKEPKISMLNPIPKSPPIKVFSLPPLMAQILSENILETLLEDDFIPPVNSNPWNPQNSPLLKSLRRPSENPFQMIQRLPPPPPPPQSYPNIIPYPSEPMIPMDRRPKALPILFMRRMKAPVPLNNPMNDQIFNNNVNTNALNNPFFPFINELTESIPEFIQPKNSQIFSSSSSNNIAPIMNNNDEKSFYEMSNKGQIWREEEDFHFDPDNNNVIYNEGHHIREPKINDFERKIQLDVLTAPPILEEEFGEFLGHSNDNNYDNFPDNNYGSQNYNQVYGTNDDVIGNFNEDVMEPQFSRQIEHDLIDMVENNLMNPPKPFDSKIIKIYRDDEINPPTTTTTYVDNNNFQIPQVSSFTTTFSVSPIVDGGGVIAENEEINPFLQNMQVYIR